MHYLNIHDLFEGNVIRIEENDIFEGYALLVNPKGKVSTFIEEKNNLYVKQTWLIEFLDPQNLNFELSPNESLTQSVQHGKQTHRVFAYVVGKYTKKLENEYSAPNIEIDEDDEDNIDYIKLFDDFGGLF